MYGIGYTHINSSFISFTGSTGWGLYVASDGDARVWLDGSSGVVSSTGQHYVGSNVVWNAGNDGSGSGLDADTVDGQQASAFVRHDSNTTSGGTAHILRFGSGSNSGHSSSSYPYAIFQEGGAWSSPYPDLRINYHTGIVIAVGAQQYDGLRFQRDYNDTTELMSIGNGDGKVRITNDLLLGSSHSSNVNTFKMAIKESGSQNAAILFLDTDNMRGGICGATKGNNELITGTGNMDFVVYLVILMVLSE